MMNENTVFANQRAIRVTRDKVLKNSGRKYACIYKENIFDACYNLKPSTFKVWMFLASNQDNYTCEYSPSYLSKVINVSIPTAKSAFTELKDKNYLIQDEEHDYLYYFYERPYKKVEKRTIYNEFTGEYQNLSYQETISIFGIIEGLKKWSEAENE